MDNSGPNKVRLDDRKFAMGAAAAFLVSFLIFLIVGITGPEVFIRHYGRRGTGRDVVLPVSATTVGVKYETMVTNMRPENQLLWLSVQVHRAGPDSIKKETNYNYQIPVKITALGRTDGGDLTTNPYETIVAEREYIRNVRCEANVEWCERVSLFYQPHIEYHEYFIKAEFMHPGEVEAFTYRNHSTPDMKLKAELYFVNGAYTQYEMGFKYFFLIMTLLVMFAPKVGFFVTMYKTPLANWTWEQEWAAILLVLLLGFNDPFFVFATYTEDSDSSAAYDVFYMFLLALFLSAIMGFWLGALDEMALASRGRRSAKGSIYYVPKVVITTLTGISGLGSYLYMRLHETGDPAYDRHEDQQSYAFFAGLLIAGISLYTIYFVGLAVRAASSLRSLSLPFRGLFVLTLVTFVACLIGLSVGFMFTIAATAIEFTLMYGLLNLYVWTLAFSYAPLDSAANYEDTNDMLEMANTGPSSSGGDASRGAKPTNEIATMH